MKKPIISFIGAGAVGTSLAFRLKQAGFSLAGIASRSTASAEKAAEIVQIPVLSMEDACRAADFLFITTSDREISNVISHLAAARCIHDGMIIAHTSGAYTSDLLSAAHTFGAEIMSFHPLQSFPKACTTPANLKNTIFTLEGDACAISIAAQIVQELGGHTVVMDKEYKTLYHASACVASNYFVSIFHLAITLLTTAGFTKELAQAALIPLVHGTLKNIETADAIQALTGPISRGDATTVAKHLEAMQQFCPDLLPLYKQLGLYTTSIATEKGSITPEQIQSLTKYLQIT